MIGFYDRAGRRITDTQWAALNRNLEYKRVDSTEIGPLWVSTVWLGLDHSFSPIEPGPIIFETMVFAREGDKVDYNDDPDRASPEMHPELREFVGIQIRYRTEEEAHAGHAALCVEIRAMLAKIESVQDIVRDTLNRKSK